MKPFFSQLRGRESNTGQKAPPRGVLSQSAMTSRKTLRLIEGKLQVPMTARVSSGNQNDSGAIWKRQTALWGRATARSLKANWRGAALSAALYPAEDF